METVRSPLVLWIRNVPVGPQLVALLWKVVGTSGGRAWLEEAGPRGRLLEVTPGPMLSVSLSLSHCHAMLLELKGVD